MYHNITVFNKQMQPWCFFFQKHKKSYQSPNFWMVMFVTKEGNSLCYFYIQYYSKTVHTFSFCGIQDCSELSRTTSPDSPYYPRYLNDLLQVNNTEYWTLISIFIYNFSFVLIMANESNFRGIDLAMCILGREISTWLTRHRCNHRIQRMMSRREELP